MFAENIYKYTAKTLEKLSEPLLLFALMFVCVYLTVSAGNTLKTNAHETWLLKAVHDAEEVTETCLFWFAMQHSQLRGLAAVINSVDNISEDDFLDALEFIERSNSIEFDSIALLNMMEPLPIPAQSVEPRFTVRYTSGDGLFFQEMQENAQPVIHSVIESALSIPNQVLMSSAFKGKDNAQWVSLAIAFSNDGPPKILLAIVNIDILIEDLSRLYSVPGLVLQKVFIGASDQAVSRKKVLWQPNYQPQVGVRIFNFRVDSGINHLQFFWHLYVNYDGGADELLGNLVQIVGSVLLLAVFILFAYLIRQNIIINARVKKRTLELEKEKNKAEKAHKVKADFLANMSHEIRTPMNAIIGLADLCLKTSNPEEQRKHLSKVDDASRSLLSIINDILDYSKIEAGKLKLECIPFSVEQVTENVVSMMFEMASQKGLFLNYKNLSDVSTYVNGDPQRLRQVLVNLLSNAIKFTEKGNIFVTLKVLSRDEEASRIQFMIEDSGIGISNEQRDLLFTAFTQGDSGTTRLYGGTGLGLVICKQLVEQMGGSIELESELGKGSSFQFDITLPVADQVDVIRFQQNNQNALDQEQLKELEGLFVLLVEDNEINQVVATALLESQGVKVDIAENGAKAVEMVEDKQYDCIFMDIHMPVMDGYNATRKIRQLFPDKLIPIIAMTANAMIEDRIHCLKVGMNDHLVKPIVPDLLFSTLRKWAKGLGMQVGIEFDEQQIPESLISKTKVLDVKHGLQKNGGNSAVYHEALKKFVLTQEYVIDEISDALQQNDYRNSIRLAHTLKGLAGLIGANDLNVNVAKLESAIKLKQDSRMKNLATMARIELRKVINEIRLFLDLQNTVTKTQHNEIISEQSLEEEIYFEMTRLLEKLSTYDADSANYMESLLRRVKDDSLKKKLQLILKELKDYEFDLASNQIKILLGKKHG